MRGRTRETNKYLNENILRILYDLRKSPINLFTCSAWSVVLLGNLDFESKTTPKSFSSLIAFIINASHTVWFFFHKSKTAFAI